MPSRRSRPAGRPRTSAPIQMVFQNPDSALNRGWTARRILARSVSKLTGLKGKAVNERVDKLAADLRLTQRHLDLKPRQLSGGLKQRVAIARAFAGDPRIVVADEPTSALDVSVQAAILNLLSELQLKSKTSYLLISHDLGVVRYLADRIAVMYLGRIMEVGGSETVFSGPNHPYTEALLSAVPNVDGEDRARILLEGEIPSPANPPTGCVFNTRCHRVIRGPVRGRRAAAGRGRAGAPDELPHPARGAAPAPEAGGRDRRDAASRRRPTSRARRARRSKLPRRWPRPTAARRPEPAADEPEPAEPTTGSPARRRRPRSAGATPMPKKLILDVDTGTDDAVALMLAALHPDLELVAATTVNGNNPVANCTDNTLRVFDLLERRHPGLRRSGDPAGARRLPDPARGPAPGRAACTGSSCRSRRHARSSRSQRAAEFLVETYMAATEPITLVPVGPLTNIAMAIKLEPRIVERIPETIIMGGAPRQSGTRRPPAEFNIWVDPEAARVVFGAGLPERGARAARRDAPGARLARRLPAAARAGHAGRRRRGGLHRGPDRAPTTTLQPMDIAAQRAGPRCPVHRLPRRPDGRHRPARSTSTSRPAAS